MIAAYARGDPRPPDALRAVKVGRRTFITLEDAEEWLQRLTTCSPNPSRDPHKLTLNGDNNAFPNAEASQAPTQDR